MPAGRPTEALIARTIAACKRSGVEVGAVRVWPDGSIVILAPEAAGRLAFVPDADDGSMGCDDAFGGRR